MHLLHQNALQVMNIVKTTFGEKLFHEVAGECAQPLSEAQYLQCTWAEAVDALHQEFYGENLQIEKLLKVCYLLCDGDQVLICSS